MLFLPFLICISYRDRHSSASYQTLVGNINTYNDHMHGKTINRPGIYPPEVWSYEFLKTRLTSECRVSRCMLMPLWYMLSNIHRHFNSQMRIMQIYRDNFWRSGMFKKRRYQYGKIYKRSNIWNLNRYDMWARNCILITVTSYAFNHEMQISLPNSGSPPIILPDS